MFTGDRWFGPDEPRTGTVLKIYPAYEGERLRQKPFSPDEWQASVRLDQVPANWPYPNTDKFAPLISEIERAAAKGA